jgi:hypothetical protein
MGWTARVLYQAGERFLSTPQRLPNLLYSGYRWLFPQGKADRTSSSSEEVNNGGAIPPI